MRCAIWYYLYNLKNVKNTHGGVLTLVKLQAEASKAASKKDIKVACRVRVAYQFFTVFLNKFLKHVCNTILKSNNHT